MTRFWRWLLRFAERRLKAQPGVSLLCKNCQTWSNVVPVRKYRGNDMGLYLDMRPVWVENRMGYAVSGAGVC